MRDKQYTIAEFARIFDQSKQVVRRRIDSLHLEAINRDARAFPNEPLKYDFKTYTTLADSFGVKVEETISNDDTQQHAAIHDDDTQNDTNNDVIIEILERELQHSKEKLTKAEEEKEKLYQLLDQQQQLSLSDRNKINTLELEINDLKSNRINLNDAEESMAKEKPNIEQDKTTKKKSFLSRLFGK